MKNYIHLASLAIATLTSAQANILLNETFTYPDGNLTTVSNGTWEEFSGTGGEVVVNNVLTLDDNSTGDDSRPLSSNVTTGTVFIGFDRRRNFYSVKVASYFRGRSAGFMLR